MKNLKEKLSLLVYLQAFLLVFLLVGCKQESGASEAEKAQESLIDVEQRLKELGIELHTPDTPVANYVQSVRIGNLVFLAGHGPKLPEGGYATGKVGQDIDLEQGNKAARLTAINLLSSLKAEIGDLNKVTRIVRVFGMVNATDSFTDHPKVINGCSDLLVSFFGYRGKHARAAVGMVSLPMNIATEIEMVVEVKDE